MMVSFRENSIDNDLIYLFRGEHFWKYNLSSKSLYEERSIKDVWPDVITPISAISEIRTQTKPFTEYCEAIVIVKSSRVWVYECKEEYDDKQLLSSEGHLLNNTSTVEISALISMALTKNEREMVVYFCNEKESQNVNGEPLCYLEEGTRICQCFILDNFACEKCNASAIVRAVIPPHKTKFLISCGNRISLYESNSSHSLTLTDDYDIRKSVNLVKKMNGENCDELEETSSIETTKQYTIEHVFEEYVGEFGNYQKLLTLYLWIIIAPLSAILFVSSILILLIPPHWCKYQTPNVTEISINESSTDWHSYYIPRKSDGSSFESCFIQSREVISSNKSEGDILKCEDGWNYDHSLVIVSAASENDWVCDNQWKALLPHSVFAIGMTIGGVIIGILSDKIGRIPTIALGCFISAIASVLSTFTSQNYTLFVIARAVIGTVSPAILVPLVVVAEFIGSKHRFISILGFFMIMYTSMGALPWIAYAIGNWKTYNLITSCCLFLVPLLSIFTLESPRWLLAVGKITEERNILAKLERINGRKIPNSVLMNLKAPNTSQAPFKHIFKYKIFLRTFVLSSTIAAILYSITVFIPKDLDRVIMVVAFSARMGITALMNINAVYSSEIFPTIARSRLSSVRLCIGSLGTVFSPFLVNFEFFGPNTPLFLFGISLTICGFLMFPMPETLGKPLPETFEDAEKLNLKFSSPQQENNNGNGVFLENL
ncbi:organic cation/carnitine transporter-like protein, partial [Dinothrombium tinctorium]